MTVLMKTPGLGHNLPADPAELIKDRVERLLKAANLWLADVPVIRDADTAKRCEDFLAQVRAETVAADAERRKQKKPHEDEARAIEAKFKPLLEFLDKIKALLTPRKTAWLQAERDRIAAGRRRAEEEAYAALHAEEAARQASAAAGTVEAAVQADEAARQASSAVKAAEQAAAAKAQIKGDFATRASGLRTYWSAEITNYSAALAHYGSDVNVRAVVQKLANADARNEERRKQSIPGVKWKSEERA